VPPSARWSSIPTTCPQKFALAIDLQYETVSIGIVPEDFRDVTPRTSVASLPFDQRLLDNIFQELGTARGAPQRSRLRRGPCPEGRRSLALARDYVSKGMMDLAVAEAMRAVQRGAAVARRRRWWATSTARRDCTARPLERYREARTLDAANAGAALGEVKSLLAVHRSAEALPLRRGARRQGTGGRGGAGGGGEARPPRAMPEAR